MQSTQAVTDPAPPGADLRAGEAPVSLEFRLLRALGLRAGDLLAAGRDHPAAGLAQSAMAAGLLGDAEWWPALAGLLGDAEWWPALAGLLGIACRTEVDAADMSILSAPVQSELDRHLNTMMIRPATGEGHDLAIAPVGEGIARTLGFLSGNPGLRARVVVVPPAIQREARRRQIAAALEDEAVNGLSRRWPIFSARVPPPAVAVLASTGALALAPLLLHLATPALGLAGLALFLPLGLLRFAAALDRHEPPEPPPLPEADLPRYAVLVPLYHEAAIVPDLAAALARLDYPRDRLDLKVVVEADDAPTRLAAEADAAFAGWDVVAVPPSEPRTKPKALTYALQLVEADLVTVYDAEDRPDPQQLRRAAAAFAAGPEDLFCVQAALDIDHVPAGRTWISRQFAMEYRMLFRGLLPWLGRHGGWFPIGGTSNHFRLDVLRAAGGWDPFNVTEDADIAVRLARLGGRITTIACVTGEEAPVDLMVWTAQRSRWLKGWIQTLLVHARRPARLARDLGVRGLALVLVLFAGQILSAFLFPASLVAVALAVLRLAAGFESPAAASLDLVPFIAVFLLAWTGAGALAFATRGRQGRWRTLRDVATLPAYWLLLFPAALRAALDLARHPFRWQKTPHGRASRPLSRRRTDISRRG